ncbi:MAG: hypothetical protein PHX20_02170 [Candidatus Omnitrophica bacterium]|nr:hypothetical protein [Candidatus Omnitrophota bacterium]
MNKKWLIISAAALIIVASITIFVFAQGGIRLPGGIAHKESIVNKLLAIEEGKVDKKAVAKVGAAAAANYIRPFDDTDRFVPDKTSSVPENPPVKPEEAMIPVVEKKAVSASVSSSGGGVAGIAIGDVSGSLTQAKQKSESIVTQQNETSMPQLPLIDSDYGTGDDGGGTVDVALPELPDGS